MLTSIQRNFRGFNYKKDYASVEEFWKDMKEDENDNSEICWAKLINGESGDIVAEHKRGMIIGE